MTHIIINLALTIISAILWKKYKFKYAPLLFYMGVFVSVLSIWAYLTGDILHINGISNVVLILIFTCISWLQTKDKFWKKLMVLSSVWLLSSFYSFYLEEVFFQPSTKEILISKFTSSLISSALLGFFLWIFLPTIKISKKPSTIIAISVFIVLTYFDIKLLFYALS